MPSVILYTGGSNKRYVLMYSVINAAETIQVERKKLLGNEEPSEHSELPGQKTRDMVLCGT